MGIVEITEMIGKEAHEAYLANWEIKTQVAENNGEWNQEIQHQVLENMEKMTSALSMLARSLSHYFDPNDTKTTL